MASRITFRSETGFTLCILDFSNLHSDDDALALVDEARVRIAELLEPDVRVLIDLTDARMSPMIISALVELAWREARHVTRTAFVCTAMVQRVAFRRIRRLVIAEMQEFRTRADALAYLTGQTRPS